MSRKYYHWHNIKCPFFKCDEALYITCEGCNNDAINRLTFKNKEKRMEYEKEYCYDVFKCNLCPVNKIAREKYDT